MHRTGFGLARASDRRRLRTLIGGAAGPVTHAAGELANAVAAGAVDHVYLDATMDDVVAVLVAIRRVVRRVSVCVVSDDPEDAVRRLNLSADEVRWCEPDGGLVDFIAGQLAVG